MTRGERNNNPGNIIISNIKWQGKVEPSKDDKFETFSAPVFGIRAIAKSLLSDQTDGINTVRKIITKYAPSIENNTEAYISAVCKELSKDSNVTADEVIDLDDYDTMYLFVKGIIIHENGECIYADSIINQALNMAGVYNVPKPSLFKQPETHVAAGAGAIATVSCISDVMQSAAPTVPVMQQVIAAAPWVVSVVALLGLGYLGYVLYKKHKQGLI